MDELTLSSEELTSLLPDLLKDNGCIPLRVTGYSMRPLLRHEQDTVWLRACPKKIRPGQILLYQRFDGKLVLHRVHRILSGNRYRMNGDAQAWCEIIHHDQLIAEAHEIQRGSHRIPCRSLTMRLWAILWRTTRPFRPILFRMGHILKHLFD